MSVVNVALLREIMDKGPDGNPYYNISVGLVVSSLCLQVLAGILAVMVTNLLSYSKKYGSNACQDCRENLFPCQCVRVNRRRGRKKETATSGHHGEDSDHDECYTSEGLAMDDELEGFCCGCCPCDVSTEVYPAYEYQVLHKYMHWRHRVVDSKIKQIHTTEELAYQVKVVEEAKKQLDEYNQMLQQPGANKQEVEEKLRALRAEMELANKSKEDYMKTLRKERVTAEQAKILRELAEVIRKERLMKVISFWQDMLNYLFYIVFVLNAFVVGFGIASGAAGSEPEGGKANATSVEA